jgi:hypothetical protein
VDPPPPAEVPPDPAALLPPETLELPAELRLLLPPWLLPPPPEPAFPEALLAVELLPPDVCVCGEPSDEHAAKSNPKTTLPISFGVLFMVQTLIEGALWNQTRHPRNALSKQPGRKERNRAERRIDRGSSAFRVSNRQRHVSPGSAGFRSFPVG